MNKSRKVDLYNLYKFIHRSKGKYSIKFLCELAGISPNSYHGWVKRGMNSSHFTIDSKLAYSIFKIFYRENRQYGSKRLAIILNQEFSHIYGQVSQTRVAHYMKIMNLISPYHNYSKKDKKPKEIKNTNVHYENMPNRKWYRFTKKNQLWVTDVAYVKIIPYDGAKVEYGYLSVIRDVATGYIVDQKVSSHNDLKLFQDNLFAALKKRNINRKLIIHSDHGYQYTSIWFRHFAELNNIEISMSRVGNSVDNAMCETFFSLLRHESLNYAKICSLSDAIAAIDNYIDYYNNRRLMVRINSCPVDAWNRIAEY